MRSYTEIACKDCRGIFRLGEEARASMRRAGLSEPERCPDCRKLHGRETRMMGCSHVDIPQVRLTGRGGLAYFERARMEPRTVQVEDLSIDPAAFPIQEIVPQVLEALLDSPEQVHVVVCPTGSGKSTWLPYKMLTCEELIARGPIYVTQPRIPAVEGPVGFIAKMYYGAGPDGETAVQPGPGVAIGYRHSKVESPRHDSSNNLVFMTDGTTLNLLQSGEIRRCSVLMIDEAHERNLNIDLILALLRQRLPSMPRLKVLIASATVDPQRFIEFFRRAGIEARRHDGKGFTYPILQVWADEAVVSCPVNPPGGWTARNKLSVQEEELLGPAPVWLSQSGIARYYPQFQALVASGDPRAVAKLRDASQGPGSPWNQSVASLEQALRDLPAVWRRQDPGRTTKEDRAAMLEAALNAVVRLCRRDEQERHLRLQRWQRRASEPWSWPKLSRPALRGHILVFVATKREVDGEGSLLDLLREKLEGGELAGKNSLHAFHKDVSTQEREGIQQEPSEDDDVRRIIVATNLAETSLTLPGLVYVVDTGMIIETRFDSKREETAFPSIWHSQAGCRQRIGRVGRKEPGEAWRLYTRKQHATQPPYSAPEIERQSAEQVLLSLASAGLAVQAPDQAASALLSSAVPEEMQRAWNTLRRVGALDQDTDLTRHGEELRGLSVEPFSLRAVLLEADRMACIWEMAIFIAFTKLTEAPFITDKTPKRLALWQPDGRPVCDDESPEEGMAADPQQWENPFVRVDLARRQMALYPGVLDDLELYLRVWQGWWAQPDEAGRRRWAREHGVSHEALRTVQRTLGLREDVEEGLLVSFLPKEKGIQRRDMAFHALDKVRWLYAAALDQQIFQSADGQIRKMAGPAVKWEYQIHPESVWARHRSSSPLRFGLPAQLRCFAATDRGGDRTHRLRHIVWLDPDWFQGGKPSTAESLLSRASRFAELQERYLAASSRPPFATGEALARLAAGPGLDHPPPDVLKAWRESQASAIEKQQPVTATLHVAQPVHGLSDRITLWQLETGALVGLDALLPDGALAAGRRTLYLQKASRPHGMIAHSKPQTGDDAPPARKAEAPSTDTLRSKLPDGAIVIASVKGLGKGFHGFEAALDQPDSKASAVPVWHLVRTSTLRAEAVAGRRCRLRVRWQGASSQPAFDLVGWQDGSPVLDLQTDLGRSPLEGRALAPAQVGGFRGYQFFPDEVPWLRGSWLVGFSQAPEQIQKDRRCLVRITGWKPKTPPTPFLIHVRWLDK